MSNSFLDDLCGSEEDLEIKNFSFFDESHENFVFNPDFFMTIENPHPQILSEQVCENPPWEIPLQSPIQRSSHGKTSASFRNSPSTSSNQFIFNPDRESVPFIVPNEMKFAATNPYQDLQKQHWIAQPNVSPRSYQLFERNKIISAPYGYSSNLVCTMANSFSSANTSTPDVFPSFQRKNITSSPTTSSSNSTITPKNSPRNSFSSNSASEDYSGIDEFDDDDIDPDLRHIFNSFKLPQSKSPVIEAMAFCAVHSVGVVIHTNKPNCVKFRVTNFDAYYNFSCRVCSKQRPTREEGARVKALKRWFVNFPKKKDRISNPHFILEVKDIYCGKVHEMINRNLGEVDYPSDEEIKIKTEFEEANDFTFVKQENLGILGSLELSEVSFMCKELEDSAFRFQDENQFSGNKQPGAFFIHALNKPENNVNARLQQQQHQQNYQNQQQQQLQLLQQQQQLMLNRQKRQQDEDFQRQRTFLAEFRSRHQSLSEVTVKVMQEGQ